MSGTQVGSDVFYHPQGEYFGSTGKGLSARVASMPTPTTVNLTVFSSDGGVHAHSNVPFITGSEKPPAGAYASLSATPVDPPKSQTSSHVAGSFNVDHSGEKAHSSAHASFNT
jgi:hypothetical protein